MLPKGLINILVDNDSWILPYAEELASILRELGYDCNMARSASAIKCGMVTFMLGCTRIVPPQDLKKSAFNLVVHESPLPQGRGFSPVAWQLLEGKTDIPICLIEATADVDAGDIWLQDMIHIPSTALCAEWRNLQGRATVDICLRFIKEFDQLKPRPQTGSATYYSRRRPGDSELSVHATLAEQFDLLRIVDNDRYPAFFDYRGCRYVIRIYADHE